MNPSKAFFISVTVVLICTISVWLFLRNFISLLIVCICSYMMSFSIRTINILIIIVLNSLSDNLNIPAIFKSSSDAFLYLFKPFSWLLIWLVIFLLKDTHNVLGKKNSGTQTFSNVVESYEERGSICSLMSMSQYFHEPVTFS